MRDERLFDIVGPRPILKSPDRSTSKSRLPAGFPRLASAVLLIIILGCIFCGFFTGDDPYRMELTQINQAPSAEHLFGTDTLGRDIFTLIWYGGRRSLFIGAFATLISTAIAVLYGSIS